MTTSGAADPGSDAWWDGTREQRLLLQRCGSCRAYQHYPRAFCLHCGSRDLALIDACGRGTVYSFTVVYPVPAGASDSSYTVALVRLEEGPLFLTHVVDASEVACEMPVRIAWEPLSDGKFLPVFMPRS